MSTYQLVDSHGRPISSNKLTTEIAAPTLGGTRTLFSDRALSHIYPQELTDILMESANGETDRLFDLADAIEERDPHYLAVLNTRKRNLGKLQIKVEAADNDKAQEEQAEFIRLWLSKGILKTALFDMLDAIGKGYSVLEIMWGVDDGRLWPQEFKYRPQKWFELSKTDLETLSIKEGTTTRPLPPHKFLVHKHPMKSGLTIRSALVRPIAWMYIFKTFTEKDWALFTQRYGMPIRIGKYGAGATEQEKATLMRAVRNAGGDMAAIMPVSQDIKFEETQQAREGSELYYKRLDWYNQQISKAVLGQTTTTDAISGGHAVSQEHYKVLESIEEADSELVSATLNSQLIPELIAFNFGVQKAYPTIRFVREKETDLANVKEFVNLGLSVSAPELRGKLGVKNPEEGEVVIGGQAQAARQETSKQEPVKQKEQNKSLSVKALMMNRQTKDTTDEVIEKLIKRTENECAGALTGLTEDVRQVFLKADTLPEAMKKLKTLDLQPAEFANALGRALVLAQLTGHAEMLDELKVGQ